MAVNPMQRKSRNSFLLGMLVMLIIGGIAVGILIYQISQLQGEIAIKESQTAYMLLQDVSSGQIMDGSMIKTVKVERAPGNPVQYGEIAGGEKIFKAKTNLTSGVLLTADMFEEEGNETKKDLRVQEYNMITLPSKLENGNYIDIRLMLASGQDYVVVPKKQVLECDTTTIWVQMSEDEIMTMNNAIVESYIMKGSNLYATVYTEPGRQDASTQTYAISALVAETFAASPNLLQEAIIAYNQRISNAQTSRTEIERALSQYSDVRKESVEEGINNSKEAQLDSRLKYIGQLDASAY